MIGVFDSGIGGLTVLCHLRRFLPTADLLYLGDTAHLPYGDRTPQQLRRYAEDAFAFFRSAGVSSLLVACGTVSTAVLPAMGTDAYPFPISGITMPSVEKAAKSGARRIALLATSATIRSAVYPTYLERLLPHAELLSLACPRFVPLAESGRAAQSDPSVIRLVSDCLAAAVAFRPELLMLGCTHFPLLADRIREVLPSARILDCGEAAAEHFAMHYPEQGTGSVRYYVTEDPMRFHRIAVGMGLLPSGARVERVSVGSDTQKAE